MALIIIQVHITAANDKTCFQSIKLQGGYFEVNASRFNGSNTLVPSYSLRGALVHLVIEYRSEKYSMLLPWCLLEEFLPYLACPSTEAKQNPRKLGA